MQLYENKKIAIIASTGRTGTQFLGKRLESIISDACSDHEPDVLMGFDSESFDKIKKYGFYQTVLGRLLGKTGLRHHARNYVIRKHNSRVTSKKLIKERAKIYDRCEHHLYIDSYPQWTLLLPLVPKIFLHYKIAAVVRHPYSYIGSMVDHASVKDKNWFGINTLPFISKAIHTKIRPEDVGQKLPDKWKDDVRLYLAWEWSYWNQRLLDHCNSDENSKIYRFEDIFNEDDNSQLIDLAKFISDDGMEISENYRKEPANAAPKTEVRQWSNWDKELIDEIKILCDPIMQEFDYKW